MAKRIYRHPRQVWAEAYDEFLLEEIEQLTRARKAKQTKTKKEREQDNGKTKAANRFNR